MAENCNHTNTIPVSLCLDCRAVSHGVYKTHEPPPERWVITTEELLKLTEKLDEHPEGWDWPCLCADCRSYTDG